MQELQGFQKKYLRGLAHKLQPVVYVGQKGVTAAVINSLEEALLTHELVKVKFVENKEKDTKKSIIVKLEKQTGSCQAGLIGHVAILFRSHPDPDKRKIALPQRQAKLNKTSRKSTISQPRKRILTQGPVFAL